MFPARLLEIYDAGICDIANESVVAGCELVTVAFDALNGRATLTLPNPGVPIANRCVFVEAFGDDITIHNCRQVSDTEIELNFLQPDGQAVLSPVFCFKIELINGDTQDGNPGIRLRQSPPFRLGE